MTSPSLSEPLNRVSMVLLRILRPRHFQALVKLQQTPQFIQYTQYGVSSTGHLILFNAENSCLFSLIFRRTILVSSLFEREANVGFSNSGGANGQTKRKNTKPLCDFFKEAVGLAVRDEQAESEGDGERDNDIKKSRTSPKLLKGEARGSKENNGGEESENLRREPKKDVGLLESRPKLKSLHLLFTGTAGTMSEKLDGYDDVGRNNPNLYKELTPDMVLFVIHLYKAGNFKDANFVPRKKFDATCFENSYARTFIQFAAEKFGRDNQEIAKWLTGSDLEKVALFGCPSLARKNVFSAKRLRRFFRIQEETVCGKCILKESCKFVNQSVWKGDSKALNLDVVMRVITLYGLESVHPRLVVPNDVKVSVRRLLWEVMSLSQTML